VFLEQSTPELRQGDVIDGVVFPLWTLTNYHVSGPPTERPQRVVMDLLKPGEPIRFVVCSHDCEIENARQRMGLLVAPITGWPARSDAADEELRASMRRDSDENWHYIHLFPMAFPDGWAVADFSGIMAMGRPVKVEPWLLERKQFELTEESRTLFREKLAAFVGRPPDE